MKSSYGKAMERSAVIAKYTVSRSYTTRPISRTTTIDTSVKARVVHLIEPTQRDSFQGTNCHFVAPKIHCASSYKESIGNTKHQSQRHCTIGRHPEFVKSCWLFVVERWGAGGATVGVECGLIAR